MEIKIEKGVPAPKPRRKYPWGSMEVGDSFFVPGAKVGDINTTDPQKSHAPKRFVSRTVTENGVKGVRVWRTA